MTSQLELKALESSADFERTYTLEEFLNLDFLGEGSTQYELLEGKLAARPNIGKSGIHGKIIFKLATHLGIYLETKPIGQGYSDSPCTLGRTDPKASWVEPDLCFVANGRLPEDFEGPIPVAPDLVVEVNSPSDSGQKIYDKIKVYRAAGVRLIWSIYQLERFVAVYRLDEQDTLLLNLKGELDGGEILPGFKMAVKKLFE